MTESQVKKNKTKDWSLTSGMHSTPGRHASGAVTAEFAPPLLLNSQPSSPCVKTRFTFNSTYWNYRDFQIYVRVKQITMIIFEALVLTSR